MTIAPEQLVLYRSLFRGREDCYARYWEKNGRSGYSPTYYLWEKGSGALMLLTLLFLSKFT